MKDNWSANVKARTKLSYKKSKSRQNRQINIYIENYNASINSKNPQKKGLVKLLKSVNRSKHLVQNDSIQNTPIMVKSNTIIPQLFSIGLRVDNEMLPEG